MKTTVTKLTSLILALVLMFSLSACNGGGNPTGSATPAPVPAPVDSPSATPEATPEATPSPTPVDTANLVEWGPDQVVEHLFFHPVISYPEFAFTSTNAKEAAGLDDWMVTVGEYNEILQNLYDKDYILVNMGDVWSEYTNEAGAARMQRNTLMIPQGKKPLIFSYDDVNYYDYMLSQGFTHKLIIGDDGDLWSWGLDPNTSAEVISQDLDAITILDKFVQAHPDFSLNGAKGCLSLTGFQGILGYRTQNDIDIKADDPTRPAFDAARQAEIAAVGPIIARLKETGWTFGSHTWGHIRLAARSTEQIQRDTLRWQEEVGTLVGPTNILFYPHGGRPDGDHDQGKELGPQFKWLQSQGFRIFASVGTSSYSQIKSTLSAVICDRLHPDGTTLRNARSKYLQFYDAKDIIDLKLRPNLPYDFSK